MWNVFATKLLQMHRTTVNSTWNVFATKLLQMHHTTVKSKWNVFATKLQGRPKEYYITVYPTWNATFNAVMNFQRMYRQMHHKAALKSFGERNHIVEINEMTAKNSRNKTLSFLCGFVLFCAIMVFWYYAFKLKLYIQPHV